MLQFVGQTRQLLFGLLTNCMQYCLWHSDWLRLRLPVTLHTSHSQAIVTQVLNGLGTLPQIHPSDNSTDSKNMTTISDTTQNTETPTTMPFKSFKVWDQYQSISIEGSLSFRSAWAHIYDRAPNQAPPIPVPDNHEQMRSETLLQLQATHRAEQGQCMQKSLLQLALKL